MCQEILKSINELAELKLLCKKKADLLNHFQSCKSLELEKIWTCLHKILEEHICPEKLNYDEANSTLLFKEENDRQYLLTCISFVLTYMQHLETVEKKRKYTQMEESFQALFYKLTEIQFMLSDKEVRVQFGKCLLHMCELNLKESEFSGRVRINLLLFFLWKGCSIEGKTADISKLKKYKDFCKYIKWGVSERTTDSFYVLCSYALNLPKFYENPDGKAFLSYVWSQSESIAFHLFNKFVHNTVILPYDNITHYSQVIYSTWKNCPDDMRATLEMQIQYLVHFALKCPIKVAARFRSLLSIFHTNKGDTNINRLIFKIYDPLIWRNLMSPNWKIRFNATCIFQHIFPVVDPCVKSVNYLQEMEKAYSALFELSEDGNACVLQAAAKCICYVLNELWEIINEEKRITLLDVVINKLLRGKHDNVKNEVIIGLHEMAKNKKMNQHFLHLFNRIKHLINDKCLRVRKNFVHLIIQLNNHMNIDFFNQIDYNDLVKRITKDFFTFNIQCCVKKLSCMKQENHEKINNNEICDFLKMSSNLITHSIWICDIKEQAKKCINLLNEYPALMICVSKFSTNWKLTDRYKLASVLFEITNAKLREDENSSLLMEESSYVDWCNNTRGNITIKERKGKEETDSIIGYKIWNDPNLNRKYVRYSSLLICVANFLKPKNEEEMELCGSEEIQDFLKLHFAENYFLNSINTAMQPFYFKLLKYLNLNHDDYLVIHKYGRKELNSLYTLKNEHTCYNFIIPLFYKWGLLNAFVKKHMQFLNVSIEFIFSQIDTNAKGTPDNIAAPPPNVGENASLGGDSGDGSAGDSDCSGDGERGCKRRRTTQPEKQAVDTMDGVMWKESKTKDMHINNEKELNALIFLSLIVKKKKYHHMMFKGFPQIVYNFTYKFSFFLFYIFEKISLNEFVLPPHFISPYYEEKEKHMDIIELVLYDKKKIKGYMYLYISFFYFFNSFSTQNKLPYEWDILIQNVAKSIKLISSIKFKNEMEIITMNMQDREARNRDGDFSGTTEQRSKWTSHIFSILHLITYFLDMVEYAVAMKKLTIDDADFNEFVKNIFLFCKCYQIVCEDIEESQKVYCKTWRRISTFLLFILNFDYYEKRTETKLMILNTFFLFTCETIPMKYIEEIMKRYTSVIKQKEILYNFLQNFHKNNVVIHYMKEGQINNIKSAIDIVLTQRDKAKK
ncbi:conserved Plasmodium protein, unknown function [Plasmodium ovale]|uniref:Condensin-2 complex subunit G2 n=1 Tax=Plasmodium ovale TaxID=36330 RepID=A0A1D3TLG0_PLAOA|nr:conserved Plasmodium protein, unknown function [Plasmodium ovale]